MTSRERVMTALNHREPDRVPFDMVLTIDVYEDLKKTLGLNVANPPRIGHWTDVQMPVEMIEKLGVDVYYVSPKSAKSAHSKKFDDGSFRDEWGCFWKKVFTSQGHYYFELENPPLKEASIEDLDDYIWPDPNDPVRYEGLYEEMKNVRDNSDLAIIAKFAGAVFELATYMRGHEQWYADILIEPEFANKLMSKISAVQMRINENCMREAGKFVDIFRFSGEDLGMQDRPLMSISTFRDVVKPHLKRFWSHGKNLFLQQNPNGKVMLHSCGNVYQYIGDLIECGVDVLDPIQPRAAEMDRFRLKKDFGDKLCFHGGIDIQHVLPFGTDKELEEEIKTALKSLGAGGGYILAPAHNVQSDVSAKTLILMSELVRKYGTYPIN